MLPAAMLTSGVCLADASDVAKDVQETTYARGTKLGADVGSRCFLFKVNSWKVKEEHSTLQKSQS